MKKLSVKVVFLLICILCIIFIGTSFFVFAMRMKQEVTTIEETTNINHALYIQSMLDDTWDSVFDSSVKIFYDGVAKNLEDAQKLNEFLEMDAYKFVQNIQNYKVNNRFLEDIVMYYPASDHIIGSLGVFSAQTYWVASQLRETVMEYDVWFEYLFSAEKSGYSFMSHKVAPSIILRFNNGSRTDRQMAVKISTSEIERRMQWVNQDSSNCFLALVDECGFVYSSVGDYDTFVDSETNELLEIGSEYLCTQMESTIDGLFYLSVTEKSETYQVSSKMLVVAVGVLVISCLIAIVLAYALLYQYTAPLDQLVSFFSDDAHESRNEFELLDAGFRKMKAAQDQLLAVSNRQHIMLSQSFLNELLFKDFNEINTPETVAAFYSFSLENSCYQVMALRRPSGVSDEVILPLLLPDDDRINVYWTKSNESVDVFLLCFDDIGKARVFEAALRQSLPTAVLAVSAVVDSSDQIVTCWRDCAEKLNCLKGTAAAISGEHRNEKAGKYLEEFNNCLLRCDYEGAQQLGPSVYEHCIFAEDPFLLRCQNYHFVYGLLPRFFDRAEDALKKLAEAEGNQTEWVSALNYLLAHRDEEKSRCSSISGNEIVQQIKRIVDLQYDNPALDLRILSDTVGFSQSYVSRLFKEQCGVGVSQYINQVRIQHAKQLLLSGEENIKVIAIKVGFAGDTQFIRAFKRVENMTPGNFRSSNLGS